MTVYSRLERRITTLSLPNPDFRKKSPSYFETISFKPVYQISWFTLCLVPSSPRNVRVIVEGNALKVSWLLPEYPYGEIIHYIMSWRRSNRSEIYMKENVTLSPFVIADLGKYYVTIYDCQSELMSELDHFSI